jgi:hypothetical protein
MGHTIGRDMRLGANLIVPVEMCIVVPIRAISCGSGMRCTVCRLLGPEDSWLVVVVVEGFTLEKMVDAVNLELETVDALLDVDTVRLRLCSRHLQGDEALLVALLGVIHAALEVAAAALNHLGETSLHLLDLIEDEANGRVDRVGCGGAGGGGIHGINGFGVAGVVVGVGLHGSKRMIRNVSNKERIREEAKEIGEELGRTESGKEMNLSRVLGIILLSKYSFLFTVHSPVYNNTDLCTYIHSGPMTFLLGFLAVVLG